MKFWSHVAPGAGRGMILSSLGLALILVSQPIAWWFRGEFTQSESPVYPAAAVLLGFLLLTGSRPFRSPSLQVHPAIGAAYLLLWLIPVAAFAMVDPVALLTDWTYSLFAAATVAVLMITPIRSLQLVPMMVTLVGGLSSILPLYELATTPLLESFIRLNLEGNNNPLVLGTTGGITMISAVLTLVSARRGTILLGLTCGVAFAAGLACVILSNTRSVMLALVYSLPLLFLLRLLPIGGGEPRVDDPPAEQRSRSLTGFLAVLGGGAVAAPAAAAAVFGTELLVSVARGFTDRFGGALAFLLDDQFGTVDRSSQDRADVIISTFENLNPYGYGMNAQLLEKGNLLGKAVYPHFTYLQAFYDLGVVGAVLFSLINLVLPVALIVVRIRAGALDPATIFFILFYAFSHMDHLTHGTPYFWLVTLPVAMVYAILPRFPPVAEARTAPA